MSQGIAILTGAELNAEIEHASPYGKGPGTEERARETSDRRAGGPSVSSSGSALASGMLATPRSIDSAAGAETRTGCGGCGRDLADEVVESAW